MSVPQYREHTAFSLRGLREKLDGMTAREKADYIFTYYKLHMIAALCVIFLVLFLGSFAVQAIGGTLFPKQQLSLAVVAPQYEDTAGWEDRFKEEVGFDSGSEVLNVLYSVPPYAASDSFSVSLALWTAAGQPDIMLCTESCYDKVSSLGFLEPLSSGSLYADVSGTGFVRGCIVSEEPIYMCRFACGTGTAERTDALEAFILYS